MASGLLYGRLCIIIAVVILLFLPLTFSTNNINHNALAQTPHCGGINHDVAWCIYETRVENYPWCVQVWTEHNEHIGSLIAGMETSVIFVPEDVSERCQLPPPPEPLQPLDCNQLGTCPSSPETPLISCEVVSPTPTVEQEPISKKIRDFLDEKTSNDYVKKVIIKTAFKKAVGKLVGKIAGSAIVEIFTPSPLAPSDCGPGRCGIPLWSVPPRPDVLICR